MDNTNQTPDYNYGNTGNNNGKRNNNILILLGILAALLLGGNIWQWSAKNKLNTQLTSTQTDLDEQTKLREEFEKQFSEASLQLEELKANNTSLTGQIDQYQRELQEKKTRINALLQDSKNLGLVRNELAAVKADYEARLAQLTADVSRLTGENTKLTGEKTQLETDLSSERSAKAAVIAEKQAVVAERTTLQEEKVVLTKKVDIASAVRISNIVTTPLAVKGSGKEKETTSADKVARLKMCFNTTENNVAVSGREQFYIRIINTTGETMAVERQGGGILTNSRGEQIPYSQIKEVDYSNTPASVCTVYEPGQTLKKGNYDVEIYNKGFLVGRGNFTLK